MIVRSCGQDVHSAPHIVTASLAQILSHCVLQQNESTPQTVAWQAALSQPVVGWAVQQLLSGTMKSVKVMAGGPQLSIPVAEPPVLAGLFVSTVHDTVVLPGTLSDGAILSS